MFWFICGKKNNVQPILSQFELDDKNNNNDIYINEQFKN